MQLSVELERGQAEVLNDLSRREGRSINALVAEAVAALLAARRAEASADSARDQSVAFRPEPLVGLGEDASPSWEDMDGLAFQRLVRSQ